jgi:hypothetical protein
VQRAAALNNPDPVAAFDACRSWVEWTEQQLAIEPWNPPLLHDG